jgi:uncharacterized protein (DUF1778 family)
MSTQRNKSETISIRTTPSVKRMLEAIAEKEHRSVTNCIEALILERYEALMKSGYDGESTY